MTDQKFMLEVMRIVSEYELYDDVRWGVRDGVVSFYVICNDLFFWGTCDAEDITPDNLHELERASQDEKKAIGIVGTYASSLFCARVRKMRPQNAAYPQISKESSEDWIKKSKALWALFDECGPPREPGLGNPRKHPSETVAACTPAYTQPDRSGVT